MKKLGFIAVAALALAGCAEDAYLDSNMSDTKALQEIKLGTGAPGASVVTGRGMGTVGDMEGQDANVWKAQTLKVYSFKRDADMTTEGNIIINNEAATAPTDVNSGAITFADTKYYPLQGAYHFTGYYTDDATTGTPTIAANSITIPITVMDGTQDVMIADAKLSTADTTKLVQALITNGKLQGATTDYLDQTTGTGYKTDINPDNKALIEAEYVKAFSSYTARREIQPNLVFSHVLSRLVFHVVAGDDEAMNTGTIQVDRTDADQNTTTQETLNKGVYVNKVVLNDAISDGTITINNNGSIAFTAGSTKADFTLKDIDGTDEGNGLDELTEIKPTSKTDKTRVGESILTTPAASYTADITIKQYVDSQGKEITDAASKEKIYPSIPIQLGKDAEGNPLSFEAGKSYNVVVTVYSNQEIKVTATLTGWVSGGDDIVVSPEDDYFNQNP